MSCLPGTILNSYTTKFINAFKVLYIEVLMEICMKLR